MTEKKAEYEVDGALGAEYHVSEKATKYLVENDRVIAFKRIYMDVMGDAVGALWLSQLAYWQPLAKRKDGFVFKKYAEWERETGLSAYQVKRSADKAEAMGIVWRKKKLANGAPTYHYKINHKELNKVINSIIEKLEIQEPLVSESEEPLVSESEEPLVSLTETTQKNTQKITNSAGAEKVSPSDGMSDNLAGLLGFGDEKLNAKIKAEIEMQDRICSALKRNINFESKQWRDYHKKLIRREAKTGQTIEGFMSWFRSDDFRAKSDIYLTPTKIEDWWQRAFEEKRESTIERIGL